VEGNQEKNLSNRMYFAWIVLRNATLGHKKNPPSPEDSMEQIFSYFFALEVSVFTFVVSAFIFETVSTVVATTESFLITVESTVVESLVAVAVVSAELLQAVITAAMERTAKIFFILVVLNKF
jgi:hypothetical protein